MSSTSDQTTQQSKTRLIVGEIGVDTETGIIGKGHSYDNGKTFVVDDTIYGRIYHKDDHGRIWNGIQDKVEKVVKPAKSAADSAVAYANNAIEKSRVNSQAIDDINSAVSDAASDAAVARSDGLRAWNAAQSNVNLIDLNYASASASISSARTEAIAAADEAKASASAAQADIVAVRSDVAAVQADVTINKSDVAAAKSDISVVKADLASQATNLSSYAAQASAAGKDITTLKSQAGQLEQDMADTKGDVSQLKVSASAASVALSDAAGNISSLQATAKSYSAALSDTNSNVASVTATARELETKYADAAGDINKLKTDAKGTTQTLADAQGDIAKLKIRADGFDTEFADTKGNISKLQTDASGTKQTLTNAKSDIAVLQSRADGFDAKYANVAGDINTFRIDVSGFSQTLVSAKGDISTLKSTVSGVQTTLTDAQGNISTLQSDVAGLKKTTSDHAGNIATLQASAKTLTSQMSDAQGNISTLQQTASDFSSKVSGMETSLDNANGKINDITSNGGGRNLLRNSNVELYGKAYGFGSVTLTVDHLESGETYTMSWYGKVDANATKHKQPLQVYIYNNSWSWAAIGTIPYTANEYQRNVFTFTVPNNVTDANRVSFYLKHYNNDNSQSQHDNDSDAGIGYVKDYMLEKGTVAHDWSPAPEDIDTKITTNTTAIEQNKKAITLKADQATVDKTNGTVQQLQSQLKVQADQIASKVSSSDLDAKGYATQTYTQTQVKQTSDSWNANLASVKDGLTQSYTNLSATVDSIQAQVYNSDGSSKITQLSNLIATKVSQGDYNSQITQLKNDINLRVTKGDLISQINLQAGTALIQSNKLVLDNKTTVITGEAFIPSAAISSISADKIMLGSTSLYNSDGTMNLVNTKDGTTSKITVTQGSVNFDGVNKTASIIRFASDNNTNAFTVNPTGATVTPTLFFERFDQPVGHWLGFTRNSIQEEGVAFNTWDNDGERFAVACRARFEKNLRTLGVLSQGSWDGTPAKPEAGVLTIKNGNTIWSGSDFLAVGSNVTGTYTGILAKAFVQQSTLSAKTNIETVDPKDALDLVNKTDIRSYQYKSDVALGNTKRYTSLIIDDVNDVSQYYAPNEFTNEERTGRDDGSAVGFLFLAVKELTRRIKNLEEKLNG